MRSIGWQELLVILGLLVVFLLARRTPELFRWLGVQIRSLLGQLRWIYHSLGGTPEQERSAEVEVGRQLAARFLAQAPPTPDPDLQSRVRQVAARLAAHVPGRQFIVQVVEAPSVNAYALPGGYVFLSRALVDGLENAEDELAFLIAHEMGHVVRGHPTEKVFLDTLLGAVRSGQLLAQLVSLGHSREQELEADEFALELLVKAGFRSEAGLDLMDRLAISEHARSPLESYWSTHPSLAERRQHLRRVLQRAKPTHA